jgi:hypothetical protein
MLPGRGESPAPGDAGGGGPGPALSVLLAPAASSLWRSLQQLSKGGQGVIGFILPVWKSRTGEVKSPPQVFELVNSGPELALWVTRLLIPFSSRDPAAPCGSGNIYGEPWMGQAPSWMWGFYRALTLFM